VGCEMRRLLGCYLEELGGGVEGVYGLMCMFLEEG
jgi:hypothetical protein